jgi:hypothetical protein
VTALFSEFMGGYSQLDLATLNFLDTISKDKEATLQASEAERDKIGGGWAALLADLKKKGILRADVNPGLKMAFSDAVTALSQVSPKNAAALCQYDPLRLMKTLFALHP